MKEHEDKERIAVYLDLAVIVQLREMLKYIDKRIGSEIDKGIVIARKDQHDN